MWNNATGELLCRQEPVYGGTHKIDLPAYDEKGYHGLDAPPLMSGVTIRVIAVTNS
eukprot:gene38764-3226_t